MDKLKAELNKNQFLLSVLALLLLLNFIVVPAMNWQDAKVISNQRLVKQYQKTQQVINAIDKNQELKNTLSNELQPIKAYLYPELEQVKFKLQIEQEIEVLLSKNQLDLLSIGWQNAQILDGLKITKFDANLRVKGRTINLIHFFYELENNPKIQLNDFNIDITSHGETLGNSNAKFTVAIYQELVND